MQGRIFAGQLRNAPPLEPHATTAGAAQNEKRDASSVSAALSRYCARRQRALETAPGTHGPGASPAAPSTPAMHTTRQAQAQGARCRPTCNNQLPSKPTTPPWTTACLGPCRSEQSPPPHPTPGGGGGEGARGAGPAGPGGRLGRRVARSHTRPASLAAPAIRRDTLPMPSAGGMTWSSQRGRLGCPVSA